MRPIDKFLHKPKSFWASVRSLSQQVGYSKGNTIIIPSIEQMTKAFTDLNLDSKIIFNNDQPTDLANDLNAFNSPNLEN